MEKLMAMYDQIMHSTERTMAEFQFNLMRCNDMYRLQHLLQKEADELARLSSLAKQEVAALEGSD